MAAFTAKVCRLIAERDQNQSLEAEIKKLTSQLAKAESRNAELTSELTKAKARNARLTSELATARKRSAKLNARLATTKADAAVLQNRFGSATAENVEYRHRVAELEARCVTLSADLASAMADNAEAEAGQAFDPKAAKKIARLEAKLSEANKTIELQRCMLFRPKADPTNSGTPPSRGPIGWKKRATPKPGPKKPRGAQRGHKPNIRPLTPPEQVDEFVQHGPESLTCDCGGEMERHEKRDRIKQVIEAPEKLFKVIEHHGKAFRCPKCGKIHVSDIASEVAKLGLFGPRMVAIIIDLRFECNASVRAIQRVLKDMFGFKASTGCICETINRASTCLEPARQEIQDDLKNQPVLNIDETSHKENGKRLYVWCLAATATALFMVGNRSREILDKILTTSYTGVIGCDRYGVYFSFCEDTKECRLQLCLSHFGRDLERCVQTVYEKGTVEYGEKMKRLMGAMIEACDDYNEDQTPEKYAKLRRCVDEFETEGKKGPATGDAARIARRFPAKGARASYTIFIDYNVERTNNRCERIIRKIVILRHVTQGTRSEAGRLASERYWSIKASCELQDRSFHDFFVESYNAWLKGRQTPSILPEK
jgi:hypothetical protein